MQADFRKQLSASLDRIVRKALTYPVAIAETPSATDKKIYNPHFFHMLFPKNNSQGNRVGGYPLFE
jgi:hypothetical protein